MPSQLMSRLQLDRLVITQNEHIAYDEKYNPGVNIIHSTKNGAGKTTIMDFIFYILGGQVEEWTKEAILCDFVYAQVKINNVIYTFKRKIPDELNTKEKPSTYVFEGDFVSSNLSNSIWLKFSHTRSKSKESFSQFIFEKLNYPEQKLSNQQSVTFHEMLRLFYCDQLTSVNHIFRSQIFDSEETKKTVGEILLGIDDFELHSLRSQFYILEKKIENINGKIKANQNFFDRIGIESNIDTINSSIFDKKELISNLKQNISTLESKSVHEKPNNDPKIYEFLSNTLIDLKAKKQNLINKKEELKYEIIDSKEFIYSLKKREKSLIQSELTRKTLGEIQFSFCPACLNPIVEHTTDKKNCHLCKSANYDVKNSSGHLSMQYEIKFQIRESEELFLLKNEELQEIEHTLKVNAFEQAKLQDRINNYIFTPNPIIAELKDSLTQLGYLNNSLEEEYSKLKIAELLNHQIKEKENHENEAKILSENIQKTINKRKKRVSKINGLISNIVIDLLHKDIKCEESFAESIEFEFDFAKDRMFVDGNSKFSASSICYLKSAFFLSLFLASLSDNKMRYPRFVLLDNIEDKGATPDRVNNMHDQIINLMHKNKNLSKGQIIFTTSLLQEKYKNSTYCIGPEYSYSNKTLNLLKEIQPLKTDEDNFINYFEKLNNSDKNNHIELLISKNYFKLLDFENVISEISLTNIFDWICDDFEIIGYYVENDHIVVKLSWHATGKQDLNVPYNGESLSGNADAIIDYLGNVTFDRVSAKLEFNL